MLERTADEGNRLLGSFNEIVAHWLDFFTYAQFIDRDGKFQLKMLSTSAFTPLSRSMGPMLKEESFHLGTGNNGLLRIIKAGRVPPARPAFVTASATDLRPFLSQQNPAGRKALRGLYLQSGPGKI